MVDFSKPDYVGIWYDDAGPHSMFLMVLTERDPIGGQVSSSIEPRPQRIGGSIKDNRGLATFKGRLEGREIGFTKEYLKWKGDVKIGYIGMGVDAHRFNGDYWVKEKSSDGKWKKTRHGEFVLEEYHEQPEPRIRGDASIGDHLFYNELSRLISKK